MDFGLAPRGEEEGARAKNYSRKQRFPAKGERGNGEHTPPTRKTRSATSSASASGEFKSERIMGGKKRKSSGVASNASPDTPSVDDAAAKAKEATPDAPSSSDEIVLDDHVEVRPSSPLMPTPPSSCSSRPDVPGARAQDVAEAEQEDALEVALEEVEVKQGLGLTSEMVEEEKRMKAEREKDEREEKEKREAERQAQKVRSPRGRAGQGRLRHSSEGGSCGRTPAAAGPGPIPPRVLPPSSLPGSSSSRSRRRAGRSS